MEQSISADKEKFSVALSSVAGALVITGLKTGIGIWTGSLGILSEAAHSGLDLVAALMTLFAVRVSGKPADKSHLYGHGKVENLSALAETFLLLITCFWIIREAVMRLFYRTVDVEVNFWSFFVIVVSIIVDYSRSRALKRVAIKYKSQALEADALHFSTDIWSSAVVLLGLVLTMFELPVADSIAAVLVAFIVIYVSIQLGKRTIDELLDRAPEGVEEKIKQIAERMHGVVSVQNIRVRGSGAHTFVDLQIQLHRTLPFETANVLVHSVEKMIQEILPGADVVIHPEPVETPDETISDKIRLMMMREGLVAHDVAAFMVDGKYHVEFQLEFHQEIDFVRVHETVDAVEAQIKRELPDVASVVVHIEDSKEHVVLSTNVTRTSEMLMEEITQLALSDQRVIDCSIVSVLDVNGKHRVSMNCIIDKKTSLEEVHDVSTALENRILAGLPQVLQVTIHTEPSAL